MPYFPSTLRTASAESTPAFFSPRLLPQEVAFLLQTSVWQVYQMRRKGRRLRAEGRSDVEIIEAGALPPTHRGNFPSEILPFLKREPIAVVVMERLLEGVLFVPWTTDPKAQPAPLTSVFRSNYR